MRSCSSEPPMLLIPPGEGVKNHRRLYSIGEQKLYSKGLYIPYDTCCGSSSYGWLAFPVREEWSLTLFNPFSGSTIKLPPIILEEKYFCPAYRISNVIVLSCDPSFHPDNFVVAAIVKADYKEAGSVTYIRSGEQSWTFSDHSLFGTTCVCFYQGHLYATDRFSNLISVDLSQTRVKYGAKYSAYLAQAEPFLNSSYDVEGAYMTYLVELEGELLLVSKCYRESTLEFKVFKLNNKKPPLWDSRNTADWVEIHNLGDFSLFLGDNESFLISASNFPKLQSNCVYYIHHKTPLSRFDIGVFDLGTKNISHYYNFDHSDLSMPGPVWISPKLGANLLNESAISSDH